MRVKASRQRDSGHVRRRGPRMSPALAFDFFIKPLAVAVGRRAQLEASHKAEVTLSSHAQPSSTSPSTSTVPSASASPSVAAAASDQHRLHHQATDPEHHRHRHRQRSAAAPSHHDDFPREPPPTIHPHHRRRWDRVYVFVPRAPFSSRTAARGAATIPLNENPPL